MNSDWQIIKLGKSCSKIGSGATPRGGSKVYLSEGDVTLIRSQNVYNERFNRNGLVFITQEHAEQLSNVEVLKGDVLLNITGDSVARCCQAPNDVLPARVNQHVAIVRPDSKKLDPLYVRYFLVSPAMQAKMLSWAGTGGTRNALTKGMIESFEIPAPKDVKEQQAIAHILGSLDDKIELNRQMNETLEAMAQAVFKSWFVDFDPVRAKAEGRDSGLPKEIIDLFPDSFDDSELGKIPKGWKATTLKDAIDIHDSKRIPLNSRERAKRRGPYPYYGAAGIMDYVNDYLFEGIYVLVGEDGSVIDDKGHPITQYVWGQFWVNNHAHILTGKNGVTNEHLYLALKNTNIQPFVTGAVQPKVNQKNLKAIPFILPIKEIAKTFGHWIDPLFNKVRDNSEEIATLASLRDTLLPKLISGELRVPDAEKFVEEAGL